jgi:hypothetical protein
VHTVTLTPTAMTSARPTVRHTALLVIAAAALAAGACSDTSLEPTPPSTLDQQSASLADSGRPGTPSTPTPRPDSGVRHDTAQASPRPDSSGTPRPDSAPSAPRPDSLRTGPGTLWGVAVQNFVLQWKDASGVTHDSVGFRGVAGVTVTIYSTTQPDSTNPAPRPETLVATLQSDATGQFRSAKLADGWYTVRGAGGGKTGSAWAQLVRGNQFPSVIYVNLR